MSDADTQAAQLLATLSLKKWNKRLSETELAVLRSARNQVFKWLDRCPFVELYKASRAPCVSVLSHSELQDLGEALEIEVEARDKRAAYLRRQKMEWLYRNPHRTAEDFDREVAGAVESKPLRGTILPQQSNEKTPTQERVSYGRTGRTQRRTAR